MTVEAVIENNFTNEIVATLDPVQAAVLSDASYPVTRTWNTGISPPGEYAAQISIKYGDQILSQAIVPFTILPVLNIGLTVETDKAAYGMREVVHGGVRITNNGNYAIPLTGMNVTIANTDTATVLFTNDSQTADLSLGQTAVLSIDWNTGDQPKGNYQVTVIASVGGVEVNRQSADFSIIILDQTPPEVTILSPIADSVYSDIFNLTVSAIDDISGVDTVEYQFGTGQWQPLLPSDSEPNIYGATFTPTQADEGDRVISFRSSDKTGNPSAPISVHITIDLFIAFKSLTGTIAASPHIVMPGMNVSYEYSISNTTKLDVRNLKIQVPIIQQSSGLVIKTLQTTATVSAQSTYTGNFTDSVDFAPETYTAALNVLLDATTQKTQLAVDGFSVVARPVVTVEKTVATDIRLLVWINDNCHLTGTGWKGCIRNDLLERILKANVSDYKIVFDQDEFIKELRNPYYTDILILGDQHQIEDDACYELVEKINSGTGLVSTKWISHVFALKYNDMFGVKSIGAVSGNPYVTIFDSPITKAQTIGPVGPSIRVGMLNIGETIAGRFKVDKDNTTASPAIVLYTFGKGKTAYFAFDLFMMISDASFGWISQIMADTFTYVKNGQAPAPVYPRQVAPVVVSVESSSADYPFRVIESFSDGLQFYDRTNRQWVSNSPQQFDVSVNPGEKTTFLYYYLAPNKMGTYPTETKTGIMFNDEFVNLNATELDITVDADRYTMMNAVLTGLVAMNAGTQDVGHIATATQAIKRIKTRPVISKDDIYSNIQDVICAVHEMVQITSCDVTDIRYQLDELLRVEESRYYLYDLTTPMP